MARLCTSERALKEEQLVALLRQCEFGLTEAEAAEFLGWERRTVNNYLRALESQRNVYREGRLWHIEA